MSAHRQIKKQKMWATGAWKSWTLCSMWFILLLSGYDSVYAASEQSRQIESASIAEDHIRVALFANLAKRSPGQTSHITLASKLNLQVESHTGGKMNNSFDTGSKQLCFTADDYKIKVLETDQLATAQMVCTQKEIQAAGSVSLMQQLRRGKPVFTVYAGSYVNNELATQQADKLQHNLGKQLHGYKPRIVGPHYIQVGMYESEDQAQAIRQSLLNVDLDAFIVTLATKQGIKQAVWVGHVASNTQLSHIETLVKQQNYSVAPVQVQGAIIHQQQLLGTNLFPNYRVFGELKWRIKADSTSTITVHERKGREYRGVMEVSLYKGKLALVNELPLEQYVHSVVGSEVYANWPLAALKAQAVAARTAALQRGYKFEIAHVADTLLSQAYGGVAKEYVNVKQAVTDTAGEVIMQNGQLIQALFSSNAGGKTADPQEVWGGGVYPYVQVIDSPDQLAAEGAKLWYVVLLPDGKIGYICEDVVHKITEQVVNVDQASVVRSAPTMKTSSSIIKQVSKGTELTVLDEVSGLTEMNWVRGPYTAEQVRKWLYEYTNTKLMEQVNSLSVTERGPSGRVIKMKANGVPIEVSYPDKYRQVFGGLPSTLFDIVPYMQRSNSNEAVSVFMFVGKGNGHGVGMSQWGAKGLAEQGYDYKQILQYFYKNIELKTIHR